tara:strand:+ start:1821 stop:2939 length:1119 start_codon:yes stop_codon:yes gene_type:complete
MKILVSDIAKKVIGGDKRFEVFADVFDEALISHDEVSIAVGYVTEDTLNHLTALVRENNEHFKSLNLYMGMEWNRKSEKEAALSLDQLLVNLGLGRVHEIRGRFHGKIYLFRRDNRSLLATVGSSNLSGTLASHKNFELDIHIEDQNTLIDCETLFEKLIIPKSKAIEESEDDKFNRVKYRIDPDETELDKRYPSFVDKLNDEKFAQVRRSLDHQRTFSHKIKCPAKSNLNTYFGLGRRQEMADGRIWYRPRDFYEAELILRAEEIKSPNVPPVRFKVVTDDGYEFDMKRSGGKVGTELENPRVFKNLQSDGDLHIFGSWIKGKLMDAGVLRSAQPVTEEVLDRYGQNVLKLIPVQDENNLWFMDFTPGNNP